MRRRLFECAACGRQTSVTAGTLFQDTRSPLTVWFRALWAVTSQKTGTSALTLQQVLGLGSYQGNCVLGKPNGKIAIMPINFPLGSFRNSTWTGWRLTTDDRYLVLPTKLATRLEYRVHDTYWRFMSRQLRRIGLPYNPETAWRAFAD